MKLLVLAIGLWVGPRSAEAYYDPSVARWINRDPMDEKGAGNRLAMAARPEMNQSRSDVFVGNSPVNEFDVEGLAPASAITGGSAIAYGNWCGYFRSGQNGGPIDDVDAACMAHDYCLATPLEFFNPIRQICCNLKFCAEVAVANCFQSPTPFACMQVKSQILNVCRAVLAPAFPPQPLPIP